MSKSRSVSFLRSLSLFCLFVLLPFHLRRLHCSTLCASSVLSVPFSSFWILWSTPPSEIQCWRFVSLSLSLSFSASWISLFLLPSKIYMVTLCSFFPPPLCSPLSLIFLHSTLEDSTSHTLYTSSSPCRFCFLLFDVLHSAFRNACLSRFASCVLSLSFLVSGLFHSTF